MRPYPFLHPVVSLAASLVLALACCASAQAQSDKTTRLIVPFSPGGGTDALARVLSRRLEAELGETVIVENKPGAGGNIAHDFVANAAPDGKTLLFTTNSLVINPLLYPNVKYHTIRSYAPVIALAHSPVVIVAKPGAPFNTAAQFLVYAKANPGKLSYASCGNGGIHHLAGEQLKALAGLNMVHIPYKGCAVAMTDVAGGQVDIAFNSLATASALLAGGKVKGLAIASTARSNLAPALPTIASTGVSGLSGYNFDGWYAVFAPAGTPPAQITRLNAAMNKALADEDVRKNLLSGLIEPLGGAPSALANLLVTEIADYAGVIKAANITAD